MQFIDLKTQYKNLKVEINQAIDNVLNHGAYILGPEVQELENQLAEYVGVKHCITVASGHDSLVISFLALGIGPGDEVITVPFTFISTPESIAQVGATPVFVDIEPDTFNINVSQVEKAITPKTKAIMPVSLFGQMPDYSQINEIAEKYGIPVIEDGAQSFGATQDGLRSCSVTTVGATSFFPAKPLGCYGDGGAIFTNDDDLARKMRAIRVHGSEAKNQHPYLGLTGRLDTMQAAVLLAKLPTFPEEVKARQRIGKRYSDLLTEHCVVPVVQPGNTHVYAQYTIRVEDRDYISETMQKQGIPTAVYYPKGLHEQPAFASLGYKSGDFPVTERAAQEVLSLPMHPWLTNEDQDKVVNTLIQAMEKVH